MPGKSTAPQTIINPMQVFLPRVRNEAFNMSSLLPEISDTADCMQWLAKRRLIRNSFICPTCRQLCNLTVHGGSIDGKRWRCQMCNTQKSVRDGSFFSGSHLTLKQVIILMYCWAHDMPQKHIIHETEVSEPTVVDWCNFMREECQVWLTNNNEQIGGMNENGEPIIVEIDESKYFHRKYHRGQWRDGHWVFGGIERQSGKCFLIEVPDRSANTLLPLIEQNILPGSHIISDGWPSYANIGAIQHGIYLHSVVVHQKHFVDLDDANIHTENVENMWMRAKRKLRRQFGTSDALFNSYLHEFMYRNKFRGQDIFKVFLQTLTENYAL